MKLHQLGFKRKKPPDQQPALLIEHNLPEKGQSPGWLQAVHAADELVSEAIRNKVDSMYRTSTSIGSSG